MNSGRLTGRIREEIPAEISTEGLLEGILEEQSNPAKHEYSLATSSSYHIGSRKI